MPDARILDITEYTDRSNPANPVPTVLVTWILQDGRNDSFNMEKAKATRPSIEEELRRRAASRFRVTEAVTIRYAEHLQPQTPPR